MGRLDTRGKYWNSTSPEEVNRGVYGKFDADQIEERKELHARRLHCGAPTVGDICAHFQKKHGIIVHHQSEKEWALRDKNRSAIYAKMDQMIADGELEITTMSHQAIINSLSEAARSEAAMVKALKGKTRNAALAFEADLRPWSILGVSKESYLKASPEQLKEWKPRVDIELKIKKDTITMLRTLSNMVKDHSEEVRAITKQTFDMGNKMMADDLASDKKFKVKQKQKSLKKAAEENKLLESEEIEFSEVMSEDKMEELRKQFNG